MRDRLERVPSHAAAGASVLVDQLAAIASDDIEAVVSSLAPDIVVRAWGWAPGGQWTWTGDTARRALRELASSPPLEPMTMRVDIDRFFPGGDVVGFDGDLSWLVAGASGDDTGDAGARIVVRRVALVATYRDGLLAALDVYVDVHEAVAVSDRSA